MKFKTTQKAIKANYTYVLCVGYCELSYLLSSINAIAYTVRREGWASDVYELTSSVAVSTGYSPFGNIKVSHNLCYKYEQQAKDIIFAKTGGYNLDKDVAAELASLRAKFVEEVLQNEQQA